MWAERASGAMKRKRQNTKIASDEWMIANLWEIGTFKNAPHRRSQRRTEKQCDVFFFCFRSSIASVRETWLDSLNRAAVWMRVCVCVCARLLPYLPFLLVPSPWLGQRRIRTAFWRLFRSNFVSFAETIDSCVNFHFFHRFLANRFADLFIGTWSSSCGYIEHPYDKADGFLFVAETEGSDHVIVHSEEKRSYAVKCVHFSAK